LGPFSLRLTPQPDLVVGRHCSAGVEALLEALGIRAPCHGHVFWRVPAAWGTDGVEEARTVLKGAGECRNRY
jgi:hypothetical protein